MAIPKTIKKIPIDIGKDSSTNVKGMGCLLVASNVIPSLQALPLSNPDADEHTSWPDRKYERFHAKNDVKRATRAPRARTIARSNSHASERAGRQPIVFPHPLHVAEC
jgi:hypothetical protein